MNRGVFGALVPGAIALSVQAGLTAPAEAEPLADFRAVPCVYAQDLTAWQALFDAGHSRTVRLAILGDSQETCPGGLGMAYVPCFNAELYQHYGNVPESFVAPVWSYDGAFLTGAAAVGHQGVSLPPAAMLPSQAARWFANPPGLGALLHLDHDACCTPADLGLRGTCYMDATSPVHATIFTASSPSSGQTVRWTASASNKATSDYYGLTTATGTFTQPLQSAELAFYAQDVGPLPYGDRKYMNLIVRSETAEPVSIVGARFSTPDKPWGVTAQSFAAGGYRASTFLANHPDAGRMLAAYGPWDAVLLHFGANESGFLTAEQFRMELEDFIAAIRGPAWLNNPDLKVILASDPDLAGLTPVQREQWDRYVGAQYAIAQADPDVLLLNTRRLADEVGWREGDARFEAFTTPGGVHYTNYGGRVLAQLEVSALMSLPEPAGALLLAGGALLVVLRRRVVER